MTLHCFAVPALNPEPALSALNAFCAPPPARHRHPPMPANRKGPGVLVGGWAEARRRTLPGCSVALARWGQR